MHSRAWIGIVVIGILGVAIMGLMTKFAIDSNSDLRDIIRFKAAFAEEFKSSGVDGVSLRKRRGGYRLVVTHSGREVAGNLTALDEKIAEYFVRKFPDQRARILEVAHEAAPTFGCRASDVVKEREVALNRYRQSLAIAERRDRLAESLEKLHGCRLVSESRQSQNLYLVIHVLNSAEGSSEELAAKIEPSLRSYYRIHPYARMILRLVPVPGRGGGPSPDSAPAAVEVRFDSRGRKVSA